MNKLIETLTSIPSARGHEYDVIRYLRDRLKDKASECHVDGLGNLIVRMDGGLPGPTLMISAHSDEVGFIVKKIENNG
ncbi:MAG: M42 family peptidase, partial [Clostridia bacterium]|nr:M42 family peptidase [Clostridia bacterium]